MIQFLLELFIFPVFAFCACFFLLPLPKYFRTFWLGFLWLQLLPVYCNCLPEVVDHYTCWRKGPDNVLVLVLALPIIFYYDLVSLD